MIRLEMEKPQYNATEKQQKCQHYDQVNLINMNILPAKYHYVLIKVK